MIWQSIVKDGKLEKHLKEILNDGGTILEIEIFTTKDWSVKHNDNDPVCRVCEGPCEDPEVGICDNCSDEPSVRVGRFL